MKLTKDKVLALRDNADRLLSKMEAEEKDEVKKIALSYERFNSLIDSLARRVENNEKNQTIVRNIDEVRGELKKELRTISTQYQETFNILLGSLQGLKKAFLSKSEYKGENIVETLKSLKLEAPALEQRDRTDELIEAIKSIKMEVPKVEFPEVINVGNFPPQKIAQPVTHVSINALRGTIHTTSATVGTSLTPLPDYGVLSSRRAVIVYNNSSNTIYIGGSDVTASNGMPVPANSYSPILDCGENMVVYGIASTESNNVRVMEVSDERSGR